MIFLIPIVYTILHTNLINIILLITSFIIILLFGLYHE